MANRQRAVAEKALRRAIDEETETLRAELTAQLNAEKERVRVLSQALSQIVAIAQNAGVVVAQQSVLPLPVVLPPALAVVAAMQEAAIPSGPAGDLADGDDMGEGRWV